MNYLKEVKKDALLTDLIYMIIGLLFILIPAFISNFICYLQARTVISFEVAVYMLMLNRYMSCRIIANA